MSRLLVAFVGGTTLLQDSTALVAAITALVIALTTLVAGVVIAMKALHELKRNTQLTEIAAVTGESTHEIVKQQAEGAPNTS